MQEKRVPIIPIAVLIQGIIFLLMTSYGNISFIPFSGRTLCVAIIWVCMFSLIDYTYNGEIEHAIKMAIIYTVIWAAIETGMARSPTVSRTYFARSRHSLNSDSSWSGRRM